MGKDYFEETTIGLIDITDIPGEDTSYFTPWNIGMLYEVEPGIRLIIEDCKNERRKEFCYKCKIYSKAKMDSYKLVGWMARDPRLRSTGAYDCFIKALVDALDL